MNRNHKYIILTIICICSFTGLFFFNAFIVPEWQKSIYETSGDDNDESNENTENSIDVFNLTLIVDFKGQKDNIEVEGFSLHNKDTTVFDAINTHSDVDYDIYPNGDYYITHIEEIGEGWVYQVNNKYPNYAVNRYNLKDGDEIKFTYVGT